MPCSAVMLYKRGPFLPLTIGKSVHTFLYSVGNEGFHVLGWAKKGKKSHSPTVSSMLQLNQDLMGVSVFVYSTYFD